VFKAPASELPETAVECCDLTRLWHPHLADAMEIAKEAGRRIMEIRSSEQLASCDVIPKHIQNLGIWQEGSSQFSSESVAERATIAERQGASEHENFEEKPTQPNSQILNVFRYILQNGKKVRQTNGDVEAGQFIVEELSKKYPGFGVISQDQMEKDPDWHQNICIWLVNPIDGTKAFESGLDDFHVQIGLVAGDEPTLGVSYYPASDTTVWALQGQGAWIEKEGSKQRLRASPCAEKILLKSSSHKTIQTYFEQWGWTPAKVDEEPLSSTSRLLKIIQGKASLYVSLGASPQGTEKKGGVWNYGANVVIANEAGVSLTTLDGHPLDLRQPDALLTGGVLLTNDPTAYKAVTETDWQ